jgi:hypothetical protein
MARFQELKAEENARWTEGHRLSNLRIQAESAPLEERIAILSDLVKRRTAETADDYVRLGEALLEASRVEDAIAAFEKGRTQTARDVKALEGLTRAASAAGDVRKAEAYEEAAALLKRRCP